MKILINNKEQDNIKAIQVEKGFDIVDDKGFIYATIGYKLENDIPVIKFVEQSVEDFLDVATDSHEAQYNNGFLDGYNQAKSSDKKWSNKDLIKAIKIASGERLIDEEKQISAIIQSLNKTKLPDVINLEMECGEVRQCECINNESCLKSKLKTTTTPEGEVIIVNI